MALGDAVGYMATVSTGAYLSLQPGSGIEWIIHNISVPEGTSAELYYYNGSSEIKVDTNPSGGWTGYFFHCTNTHYYRVKNTSVSSAYIGYDGIVSK